jgi:hypothetical protein
MRATGTMSKNWQQRTPLFSKYGVGNRAAERAITHRAMLREVENDPVYRPPWQHPPVDPRIEHVITIEVDRDTPLEKTRMTCTCGINRGWELSYFEAIEDAATHCKIVETAKADQAVDDLPVAMIERRISREGTPEFRSFCSRHVGRFIGKRHFADKTWLPSEQVAVVSSMMHADQCRTCRPNAKRKPVVAGPEGYGNV